MNSAELEYVGFWLRVWAAVIDTVLVSIIIAPLLTWIYGAEYWVADDLTLAALFRVHGTAEVLINWILPAIAVLLFWIYRQATPGKMAIGARIVDAKTGGKPSTGQLIGRYLGYYVSIIPLGLGIIWVGIDERKQGWHDKLAGTVVVRPSVRGTRPVTFQ
ncbi:MAG: RDD family protein [Gammaproteobacteria bacterium]